MSWLRGSMLDGLLRGMLRRGGTSAGILLVATVAAAAAAAGPAYDAAARTSILRDGVYGASPIQRAVEATGSGAVAGLAHGVQGQMAATLASRLGGAANVRRTFQPPVGNVLVSVSTGSHSSPLTWHSGECTHLRVVAGNCPDKAGQVMVSASFARDSGLRPGGAVRASPLGTLTVTGVYAVPPSAALRSAYWLDGPCEDFAHEYPCTGQSSATAATAWDAMFTPAATFDGAGPYAQGQATVWYVLAPGGVRAGNLGRLSAAVSALVTDPYLSAESISATSAIPQLASRITGDWKTLDVPVFLITGELLLLAWLLLFLVATDAAEARAPEVALAKLRGYGPVRTVAFGLSEPVLLLAAGCVAGTFAGWGATAVLSRVLLRPGTPAGLPALAVAVAAAAMLGGMAAVAAAGRRALARPVTRQWQRAGRHAADRGWVVDAILLTLAVAGLAELFAGGHVTSARASSLGLLVPGLLGLSVAVVASRLLPAACRMTASATRQRGGTGLYLAVRHIARRPGGTRTTIVLTAAFSLATFALAAYAVQQQNIGRVAAARTGAAAVLNVTTPPGRDLGAIVDGIDPGGTRAAAVDKYPGGTDNGSVLLAVQPGRFARVANWTDGLTAGRLPASGGSAGASGGGSLSSPASLGAALAPPTAAPVTLPAGSQAVRLRVSGVTGEPPRGATLTLWVANPGSASGGQTPLSLGALRDGVLSAQVSQCPCQVTMVSIDSSVVTPGTRGGAATLSSLAVRSAGTWRPVPGALNGVRGWAAGAEVAAGCGGTGGSLAPSAGGLRWSFRAVAACSPAFTRLDIPSPLPALTAGSLTGSLASTATAGLDGDQLTVRPVALAGSIPGAPATGVVVDRAYAQRAANFVRASQVTEQVWVAPGALPAIRAGLRAAGVAVTAVATTAAAAASLSRQGPELASVLFLAAAGAAALLAAAAALLGLYQAGRRRRYEYAALLAGRVPRQSLRSSVFIEQAVVLGFGVVAGVAAGLVSAALVLRNMPEFTTIPAAPRLLYAPPAAGVAVPLIVVAVVLTVLAGMAAVALVRSARPELLRETAP